MTEIWTSKTGVCIAVILHARTSNCEISKCGQHAVGPFSREPAEICVALESFICYYLVKFFTWCQWLLLTSNCWSSMQYFLFYFHRVLVRKLELTLAMALIDAPADISALHKCVWPFWDTRWRGVSPFYKREEQPPSDLGKVNKMFFS